MKKKNFVIYHADPEMMIGRVITEATELSGKVQKPVIAYVRGIAVRVNKDTSLETGIAQYRRNMELFLRGRVRD